MGFNEQDTFNKDIEFHLNEFKKEKSTGDVQEIQNSNSRYF